MGSKSAIYTSNQDKEQTRRFHTESPGSQGLQKNSLLLVTQVILQLQLFLKDFEGYFWDISYLLSSFLFAWAGQDYIFRDFRVWEVKADLRLFATIMFRDAISLFTDPLFSHKSPPSASDKYKKAGK